MTRNLIILLSFLLAFSPVSSALSTEAGHGNMERGDVLSLAEIDKISECMEQPASHVEAENFCCKDDQCKKHCQTMQCHSNGKLSALSIELKAGFVLFTLSQTYVRLLNEPDNGITNTPLRPPITQL